MYSFLSFISAVIFFCLIAGLIKPTIFNKVFKKEIARKTVLLYFGVAWLFMGIIMPDKPITTPKTINNTKTVRQPKTSPPSDVKQVEIVDKTEISSNTIQKDKSDKSDKPPTVKSRVKADETEVKNEPIIPILEEDTFDKSDNPPIPQKNENSLTFYQVDRVVDGDTVRVLIDGVSHSVRLIGIDTPETVHPTKAVECMGFEASEVAKRQLEGKKVALEIDQSQGDKDKYNRLIRYVILEDGTNFNKWMILEGYAYEYTYNIPYKYQTEFKEAQRTAQANKKGLWADGVCDDFGIEEEKEEPKITTQTEETNATNATKVAHDCSSNIYNCSDFKTHAEAQSVFDYCLAQVGSDIHRLDADKNGVACESLP